jgi:hypothetical protein
MVDAGDANLDTGVLMEKRGRTIPVAVKTNRRTPPWWLRRPHLQSSALAAPWGVKISPRYVLLPLQVPALLLTTPLLLPLPSFILSSVLLVLNVVSSSVFH